MKKSNVFYLVILVIIFIIFATGCNPSSHISPPPITPVVIQISCGGYHTMALKSDGTLWACGQNIDGQLGLTCSKKEWSKTLDNVSKVACGANFTMALKSDGTLWATGSNAYGQFGDGTNTNSSAWIKIPTPTKKIKSLYCSAFSSFLIDDNSSLYVTGWNYYGQLGLGDRSNRNTWTKISLSDITKISSNGESTLVLQKDGRLFACGHNNYGQLGLGDNEDRKVLIQTAENVEKIGSGQTLHSLIVKTDGSVWVCGYNDFYQLGLGTEITDNSSKNYWVQTNDNSVFVAMGEFFTLCVKTNGEVYGVGKNDSGQLGIIGFSNMNNWTLTPITGVKTISCGISYSVALKYDGTVWVTGGNNAGQLGLGNNFPVNTWTKTL